MTKKNDAERFISIIKLKSGQYQIMSADNSMTDLEGYIIALQMYRTQLKEDANYEAEKKEKEVNNQEEAENNEGKEVEK